MQVKRMTAAALFAFLGLMGVAMAMFIPVPNQAAQSQDSETEDLPVAAIEPVLRPEPPIEELEPAQEETVKYWIKAHGDAVAVFGHSNMDTPIQITNIRVSSLRRDDQKMLEEGIPVTDEESLWMLIEDFGP